MSSAGPGQDSGVAAGPVDYLADSANYTTCIGPRAVDVVVIHVVEGSFSSACFWFRDPMARVSAHYVVRPDGLIARCVYEQNIAWHAGNGAINRRSIGIEHAGYTDKGAYPDGGAFQPALYEASAALVAGLAKSSGLTPRRGTWADVAPGPTPGVLWILGHADIPPPNDHTDPGVHWDWPSYLERIAKAVATP